jgi:hypothetical protein
MFQVGRHDIHKAKVLPFPCLQRCTFTKGGGQAQKVLDVITAIRESCSETFGTIAIVEPAGVPAAPKREAGGEASADGAAADGAVDLTGPLFEDIVAETLTWGTTRLTNFAENTRIKKAEKVPLTQFESRLLVCYSSLKDLVRLYEDSSDMVMRLGSDAQVRACPLPWQSGISEYGRNLSVYIWDNTAGKFDTMSLDTWVEDGVYMSTSLLLLGAAQVGKSRVLHMISQEVTIGAGLDAYCFGKSLDPLGVLSHGGSLRSCGCLSLTDFDLQAARGRTLSSETIKSLLDVSEGGCLQECRWRSAHLPAGMPRLLAMNGEPASYGSWFAKHEQNGLAIAVGKLEEATRPGVPVFEAAAMMAALRRDIRRLGADDQAALRRVGVAFCRESLVVADTVTTMRAETTERAAAARARRQEYWARHSA